MSRKRRISPLTAAVTTALALATAFPPGLPSAVADDGTAPNSRPPAAAKGTPARTLTLITGDRVLLNEDGRVLGTTPAEGRRSVPVQISESDGHSYVIPADVEPLIAQGRIDRSLFDATELARPEYTDLAGTGLPLIVTYTKADPAVRGRLQARSSEPVRDLKAVEGDALVVEPQSTAAAWSALTDTSDGVSELAPGVESVGLDGVVEAALDVSVPQIGAPQVWEKGYDGTGVKIAVLDTGIDAGHPDVKDKIVAQQNFTGEADTDDHNGHGTHVASTAAGTGAASDGRYRGAAPGADLLIGKVLNSSGSGLTSEIVAGMEWAVEQGADVVNMSLGAPDEFGTDPLEETVDALSDRALFVVAAGNSGPAAGSLRSPGVAEGALTVGAVDKQDALASFSSRGPRIEDGGVKPDLTAPGVDITAASAAGAPPTGEEPRPAYAAMSGTSMASPHVAGAAALLAQARPDWTGRQIKSALVGSATPGDHGVYEQGTGRVDLVRATEQTVAAEPASLNFGAVPWPHTDDEPLTRTLTYRNDGESPVDLALDAGATAPSGGAAPAGFLTLSADRITVPAGGTADVVVTVDTRIGGDTTGAYSVAVTATGAGQTVRHVGGVERAAHTFDVTFKAVGRDGSTPGAFDWAGYLTGIGTDVFELVAGEDGTGTVRVPAGDYTVVGKTFSRPDDGGLGIDYLIAPKLTVDKDMTIEIDARRARPIDVTVPDPDAVGYSSFMATTARSGDATTTTSVGLGSNLANVRAAQLGASPEPGEVTSRFMSHWQSGDTQFHVTDTLKDGFYNGHTQHVTWRDLAKQTVRLGSPVAGAVGLTWTLPPDDSFGAVGFYSDLPSTRTIYLQGGRRWGVYTQQLDDAYDPQAEYHLPRRRYEAGSSGTSTMNTGVFGPALVGEGAGLVRDGDTLTGRITPFADGEGHLGASVYDPKSASTTVYRDGRQLATAADVLDAVDFELPPGRAKYRVVTTVGRAGTGVSPVSSTVTWQAEFTSARTDGAVALPTSVVRYAPKLAADSTAPAGVRQSVPVTVRGTAGGQGHTSFQVSVSYDSGSTWRQASVHKGKVTVDNPAAGGSVSFRARVTDRKGNSFGQTIIDAYRTR
ncbi:S8 family serine peptidase [Streptomyces sp. NPDC058653]|uniref:S8 family serine peptidase n=1 Tax=Streptomyces sp. NPDC058653 TaxID=3346576 RepID=UPI003653F0D3